MKNFFLITILLCSLNISANIKEKYQSTYNFIKLMLVDEIPLNFKDAVFATEIAYFDNNIGIDDLYSEIDFLLILVNLMSNSNLISYETPMTKKKILVTQGND